jgi:hypothetical protein
MALSSLALSSSLLGRHNAGEHLRGWGGFFSGVLYLLCLVDTMIFAFEVSNLCHHSGLVIRVLECLKILKKSFGKESTRTDQPKFPPQHFLTKAILTARMSRKGQTKI